MAFEILPDEILLQVLSILIPRLRSREPIPDFDTFNTRSSIRYVLTSRFLRDVVNFSETNQKHRALVIQFLRNYYLNSLQLSLARTNESIDLVQFRSLRNNPISVPRSTCSYLLARHVNCLEICINFLQDQSVWLDIVRQFQNVASLRILGNTEEYRRIFEYCDYQDVKFHRLQKLSCSLPDSKLALMGLNRFINWKQLTHLDLFIDPYSNLAFNLTNEVMEILRFQLLDNKLKTLNFFGGNNIIYYNYDLLSNLSQLLRQLKCLEKFGISHKDMRSPSFSSYSYGHNTSYQYHDFGKVFISFFKSLRDLPRLSVVQLDSNILRHFYNEIVTVFKEVTNFSTTRDLELIIVEPTFVYPISVEQFEQYLRLTLILKPTVLSLRLGLQIEMTISNYITLLFQKILSILTAKLNFTRIKFIEYELCWCTIDDSYVREHNDLHPDQQLPSWERPDIATSGYKQLERRRVEYTGVYEDSPDYTKLLTADLVRYPLCSYELIPEDVAESHRLQFWASYCCLNDFITFNNLGNRKGGIFA